MHVTKILSLFALLTPLPALAQQCPTPPSLAHLPSVEGSLPPILSAEAIASSPALQRLASHGALLRDLGISHGMQGVFAQSGKQFRVFYLAPDGRAEIGGVMWDETGRNVTRDQVEKIPGVIPTVTWTPPRKSNQANAVGGADPAPVDPVARLEAADYGLVGRDGAPRVYMVIDPLCPYSQQAMKTLQGAVDAGHVQLALVPIAINDHENGNQSTPAANALIAAGRTGMDTAWRKIMEDGKLPESAETDPTAPAQLALNMSAAHAISIRGTPTFVWRSHDGQAHAQAGLSDNLDAFLKAIAS